MSEPISESQFDLLADRTLQAMVEVLADLEDEALDADLESGVLKIGFEDGTRYVVNSHRAARQIWMAAQSTAWHFDWDGERWIAAKTGDELWSTVESRISEKLGRLIKLR